MSNMCDRKALEKKVVARPETTKTDGKVKGEGTQKVRLSGS